MPAAGETRPRAAGLVLPLLLLMFGAGLFPLAADYVLFHPDERHYAEAGIEMLETGDWLTPRTTDGDLRLKKPILPYWCTAAGYRLAGVSPLGARAGFLLAGAAIVGLAWWGGWIAFGSRRAACFAAAVAMTQPALVISAPRSMPDVLLTLGIQLSACGFLAIERRSQATWTGLLAACGGGAIAVLSKGLPGAVFLGFAMLFTACRRPALLSRDRSRWIAAVLASVAVGGSWYALMAGLHADELVEQFTHDQVGRNRFARHAWQVALQLPLCLGWLAVMSAPWLLSVASEFNSREFRSAWWRQPGVALLVSWALLYCILAAVINHVTPRYLLPAAAPLSIVIGGLLHRADADLLARRLWLVLPIGGLLIAVCSSVVGMQLVAPAAAVPLAMAAALGVNFAVSWRVRRWPAVGQGLAIVAAVYVTLVGVGVGLSWRRESRIGGLVERQVQARGDSSCERIIFDGEAAQAAQIRVALGNRVAVDSFDLTEAAQPGDLLVLDGEGADAIDLPEHELVRLSCGYRDMRADRFVRAVLRGQLAEFLADSERAYVFAFPRDAERGEIMQASAEVTREQC